MTHTSAKRAPTLMDALIPVLFLAILLASSVYLFGDNSSYGANQIALIFAAGVAAIIALKNGYTYKEIEQGVVDGITIAVSALLILLAVGALIGTWILSGTVPTLIYYGVQILSPEIFYTAACLVCIVTSISIGSSWTTAGTLGIALIGIAQGLGLSAEITAGAVISGAYFGDKMSPLSDTTNLASAVTNVELFNHIRYMAFTTVPSIIIALILFTIIGFNQETALNASELQALLASLDSQFQLGWYLLLPLVLLLYMASKKLPAFPTIMIASIVGALFAVLFQGDVIARQVEQGGALEVIKVVWTAFFDGYKSTSGNESLDELLSRGGMSSMLNTTWLILCAMILGGILEKTGLLARLVESAMKLATSTGSLILTTLGTCVGTNMIAADQYLAIILPGRMYKPAFAKRGLADVNLSRTLEDAGTITSPLIPWNTCGAYMAGTLGVVTLAYLPFCFFNLINPIVAAIYGFINFKIEMREPESTLSTTT